MLRQIATVSFGTLSSRLLGFIRDTLMASLLGTGPAADAFLFSFQLINVARRLISEGAFNALMVPTFLRIRESRGGDAATQFAGRVLGTAATALIGVALTFALIMPGAVSVLAPGFTDHAFRFATDTARLMLPYLAFAGPVAVIMAVLNAHGRVAWSAFSPVLFNIFLIAVTLALLASGPMDAVRSAMILASTVGVAGLAQASVLAFPGARLARPVRLSTDADVLRLLRRTFPVALAQSGPQLLVVAGAIAASLSPGSLASIYFANRLIELPLGIVGIAAGTVVLTKLSDTVLRDEVGAESRTIQARAIETALSLALPAAIGLAVLAHPIVVTLFRHGAFSADDADRTASALKVLAFALPAHVLTKIISPAFFAREQINWPLGATLAGLIVTTLAAIALQPRAGDLAVTAAIAAGAWFSAGVLFGRVVALTGIVVAGGWSRRLALIALAATIMGALLYAMRMWAGIDRLDGFAALAIALVSLIAVGLVVYLGLLRLFGVLSVNDLLRGLRRDE
jgi:putative peptidoglycan lipid II flippase